ncbi:hypothetical protein ABW20_dc0104912 [Dactylellina cionopaga]|nr:hypothetical protein ABW20_dc0104912 [Dactylellina cionopaga]
MRGGNVELKGTQVYGFLRRLLANEGFGTLFTSLEIYWGKDHDGSRIPKWKEAELAKLRSIADAHGGFEEPWKEIIETLTVTREPLFIPVLCLLPNLEHFGLDRPCRPALAGPYKKAKGRLFIQEYMRIWFKKCDLQADRELLFRSFPAGLVNLRSFSADYSEINELVEENCLELIFMLPNIENIAIDDLKTDFSILLRFKEVGLKSKVKTIVFQDCRCDSDELATFIKCCDALESFIADMLYNSFRVPPLRPVREALLEHHRTKETLKYASISSDERSWDFKVEVMDGVSRGLERKQNKSYSDDEGETWLNLQSSRWMHKGNGWILLDGDCMVSGPSDLSSSPSLLSSSEEGE